MKQIFSWQFTKCIVSMLFFQLVFFHQILLAFDGKGHVAVEDKAYCLLNETEQGRKIIEFLENKGILYKDPYCHTNFPDLSLPRQFAQDRQLYHFMASNKAVLKACKAEGLDERQKILMMEALPPCYEGMYVFFRETLINSPGSKQAGRGIYVLMHLVADSYSSEHVTRAEETEEIITVKGWQLSRFGWPAEAKEILPDSTLALLHKKCDAKGDASWNVGNDICKLSKIGMRAATALKDLLVMVFNSMQPGADREQLYNEFIQIHFRPKGSKAAGVNFIFSSGKQIQYNYETEFKTKEKDLIYRVDGNPKYSLMAILETGEPKNTLGAYGLEFGVYITPTEADNSHALTKQIPVSFGASVTELPQLAKNSTFLKALKVQGFASASLYLPIVPFSLEPRIGLAALPFNSKTYFSVPLGAEFVLNICDGISFDGYRTIFRVALGYEHDFADAMPARNSFYLKMGFCTWQARFVTKKDVSK